MVRSLFLHRVFGNHIQLIRHLVSVIRLEIVVERLAVSCDGTTDTRCVRRKERSYLGAMILQIEDRERRLPLVSVRTEIEFLAFTLCLRAIFLYQEAIETFHHHSCCTAEQTRLVIVAVRRMALHLELIPSPAVYLVLLRPERIELKQDSDRLTRHHPSSYPNRDIGHLNLLINHKPIFEKRLVFFKVYITVVTEIRTEKEHLIRVLRLHRGCTCTENGIDSAYTVAHFPRCFENVIWLHIILGHNQRRVWKRR